MFNIILNKVLKTIKKKEYFHVATYVTVESVIPDFKRIKVKAVYYTEYGARKHIHKSYVTSNKLLISLCENHNVKIKDKLEALCLNIQPKL